jgi:NAD(P)-dependent dehydrogenase (short-subunit alcohol dehydrogenase family)
MQDYESKVAVVTGAASGIGLALAKRFAAQRMKLVMVDIEQGALDAAVAQLPPGTEVLSSITDVSDAAQMDALAAKTFERFGTLHVLCNNAGVGGGGGSMWDLSTRDWQWVLVQQNEGYIVNTASLAGLTSTSNLGPYNVSKHGVVTLSETLFAELKNAKSAVGISVLCPAFVNTKIHQSERNRPSELKNPPKELNEAARARAKERQDFIGLLVEQGQTAEAIADKTFAAMLERRFYVLTHPEMMPLVEQRMQNILSGRDPGTL